MCKAVYFVIVSTTTDDANQTFSVKTSVKPLQPNYDAGIETTAQPLATCLYGPETKLK